MRKIIAAINTTLDGISDHTAVNPDEEIHQYYTDLLNRSDVILYGRITYQLMEFWKPFVLHPSGEQAMDDFAVAIDKISKIVFSRTLYSTGWESARLSNRTLAEEVSDLRHQTGKDVLVGSRSLILQLLQNNLLDELQLCVHPIVAGAGSPLFKDINEKINLRLLRTKTFVSGAIMLYYEPIKRSVK